MTWMNIEQFRKSFNHIKCSCCDEDATHLEVKDFAFCDKHYVKSTEQNSFYDSASEVSEQPN
jgi:hypothetical protein